MKILIVSENQGDSQILRKVVKSIIKASIIVTAVNKAQAIEIICNDGPFAFYIIDSDIKNFKIATVIETFIELSGSRPILYTGHQVNFNASISQELFDENESSQFIAKPFGQDSFKQDLESKLNIILKAVASENREHSIEQIDPNNFIKMKLRGFYLFEEFPYDIYLEITPTRYLKLLPANTKYGHSFFASYAKKNIKFLHIKKDDQLDFLEAEIDHFLEVFKNAPEKSDDIFTLLLRSVTVLHQYLIAIGISKKAIILMEYLVNAIINIQMKNNDLKTILNNYPYYYEGISSKSILTAIISIYVARNLDWDSKTTKGKLIAASILQDYALTDEALSKVTSLKDPYLKNLSKELVKEFKEHPEKSSKMAAQFNNYTDIDSIIIAHHEFPNRKGFPNRPINNLLSQLNHVFNISQFIASKIDGEHFADVPINKILLTIKKEFNIGSAKDIYELFRKTFL